MAALGTQKGTEACERKPGKIQVCRQPSDLPMKQIRFGRALELGQLAELREEADDNGFWAPT